MKNFRLIEIAVLLNILFSLFNISLGFMYLTTGNTISIIFSMGCSICSAIFANVCATINKNSMREIHAYYFL